MPTTRLYADELITQTNLSGALSTIQDDPDSPDSGWMTATATNANITLEVGLQDPPGTLNTGAGLQRFRVLVRKQGGTGTPTLVIHLIENGRGILASSSSINVTGQAVHEFAWDASLLAGLAGQAVRLRINGTAVGGSGSVRASIDVGAVAWVADHASPSATETLNVSTSRVVRTSDPVTADARRGVLVAPTVSTDSRREARSLAGIAAASVRRVLVSAMTTIQTDAFRRVLITAVASADTRLQVGAEDTAQVDTTRPLTVIDSATGDSRRYLRAADAAEGDSRRLVRVRDSAPTDTERRGSVLAQVAAATARRVRATTAVVTDTVRQLLVTIGAIIATDTRRQVRVSDSVEEASVRMVRVQDTTSADTGRTAWVESVIQSATRRVIQAADTIMGAMVGRSGATPKVYTTYSHPVQTISVGYVRQRGMPVRAPTMQTVSLRAEDTKTVAVRAVRRQEVTLRV